MSGSIVATCPHCGLEVEIVHEGDSIHECSNCGKKWGYQDWVKMREVKDEKR